MRCEVLRDEADSASSPEARAHADPGPERRELNVFAPQGVHLKGIRKPPQGERVHNRRDQYGR
eukprot:scaffold2889_cov407-Prasinococcus_capsulatus_cf.AAC.2